MRVPEFDMRDFLVRTVAALCNSALSRVAGITIGEKFSVYLVDKILKPMRSKRRATHNTERPGVG